MQSAFCAMHFAFLKNVGNANCNVRNALCIGAKKSTPSKFTPRNNFLLPANNNNFYTSEEKTST